MEYPRGVWAIIKKPSTRGAWKAFLIRALSLFDGTRGLGRVRCRGVGRQDGAEGGGGVAAVDDEGLGRAAIPLLDALEGQDFRVFAQGLALDGEGFGFALGGDNGGFGVDAGLFLRELGLGGLLFLHHLGLDGAFQFVAQVDVFDDHVFDVENAVGLHALAQFLQGLFFNVLAHLHRSLGGFDRRGFLEGFREIGDEDVGDGAVEPLILGDDGADGVVVHGGAVDDDGGNGHRLQIAAKALKILLHTLCGHVHALDLRDKGRHHADARLQGGVRRIAQHHGNAALIGRNNHHGEKGPNRDQQQDGNDNDAANTGAIKFEGRNIVVHKTPNLREARPRGNEKRIGN